MVFQAMDFFIIPDNNDLIYKLHDGILLTLYFYLYYFGIVYLHTALSTRRASDPGKVNSFSTLPPENQIKYLFFRFPYLIQIKGDHVPKILLSLANQKASYDEHWLPFQNNLNSVSSLNLFLDMIP